jgi:hypothetical protein
MSTSDTAPAPLNGLMPTAMPPGNEPRPLPRTPIGTPFRKLGSQPIYRVIEVSRDATGRLNLHGHIWHTDLDRLRRFGRAVAANSASHRVVIADSRGELIEELQMAGPDERQPLWGAWQRIPLPPPPARAATPRVVAPRLREAVAPPPARPAPPPPSLPAAPPQPVAAAEPEVPAAGEELSEDIMAALMGGASQPPRDLPRLSSDVGGTLVPAPDHAND